MKKIDRKIEEIRRMQEELDHRTQVEEEAVRLISECRFEEAIALLDTLDDALLQQEKEGEEMKINKQKLQIALATACMTTKELVGKSGLSKATTMNALTGKKVKPVTIGKIAKALDVQVTDLIDLEGSSGMNAKQHLSELQTIKIKIGQLQEQRQMYLTHIKKRLRSSIRNTTASCMGRKQNQPYSQIRAVAGGILAIAFFILMWALYELSGVNRYGKILRQSDRFIREA